ncbi:hypothetical protein ANN_22112 [Periplaneta americana]|uniref:Uncharacterized protein n=1 Tax=Periplaneta americana TaxID=6978 RepID=A0ABQ8S7J0_PERAM|nr:hypothetical protein ANN_22112 [Periplaneta americana]
MILRSNWAEQPPVRTPEELWDRVLDAWEEMAKLLDLFHNLVDSMPRRMRAVVDAGEKSEVDVSGPETAKEETTKDLVNKFKYEIEEWSRKLDKTIDKTL